MENNKQSHQYKIREAKKLEEKEKLDFNYETDVDLNKTSIRRISGDIAKKIILEYEYLKTMPAYNKYYFGIYFKINEKEYLGGVVIYSNEYSLNTGVWDKYTFKDKLLLLSRGVCLWWTPMNTASYFITRTNKWVEENSDYRAITATVDPKAMEVGIIYQSMNWLYLDGMNTNTKSRLSIVIDGKKYGTRSIRKKYGTIKKEEILKLHPNAEFIHDLRKKRYITFLGKEKKNLQKEVQYMVKPYPTKDEFLNLISNRRFIIYKITNVINNKVYIGQTTQMFKERIKRYVAGKIHNTHLNNSYIKYGQESFKIEIIEDCEDLHNLNEREIHWIEFYNATNPEFGYNIESGGNNKLLSDETKQELSNAHKGRKQSAEWVSKRIPLKGSEEAKKWGRPKTEEQKQYLSDISSGENGYWYGKPRDIETINKIKETKSKQKDKIIDCNTQKIGVGKYDKETNELIESYLSMSQASQKLGICYKTIFNRCNGITPQKGDFILKLL